MTEKYAATRLLYFGAAGRVANIAWKQTLFKLGEDPLILAPRKDPDQIESAFWPSIRYAGRLQCLADSRYASMTPTDKDGPGLRNDVRHQTSNGAIGIQALANG